MKRNLVIFIVIILLDSTVFLHFSYKKEVEKYKNYVDFQLNSYLPNVCKYPIEMDLLIEKVINQNYITENELIELKNSYDFYIRSFVEYMQLAEVVEGYDFQETNIRNKGYKVVFEYSEFFYRINNLFDSEEGSSVLVHHLNKNELEVFKKSHEYTFKASEIIKKNIEYYNMFNIEITYNEDSADKVSFIWDVKEEYKEELPPNVNVGGGYGSSDNSIDEDWGMMEEVRYIIPEKPYYDSSDDKWFVLLKELQKLNRKEL